ncbi:uncharacterized protein LOC132787195 [Drosophila nasuta]|uniref:uncharacterized protein LOC132787195 n=1 Tax=Drosophila nasuta TaxID=42062 RepID=UPI00295E4720|nr:uncharacterized protein LOC132787195 [Drosophila nasuta]
MNFAVISSGILLCFLYLCAKSNAKRNWDYELLKMTSTSSDENLFNISTRLENGELGKPSVSGYLDWKYDCDENTLTEMKIYYSQNGRESTYREQPYAIPKMSFYQFLDQYWMNLIYPFFADCSNLPSFDKFVPPWPKKTYLFDKCRPEPTSGPETMPRGYYRFVWNIIGEAALNIVIDVKLTPIGLV